jgi:uncharacterized protein YaeQ
MALKTFIVNSNPKSLTIYVGTRAERLALVTSLSANDEGRVWFYDKDDKTTYFWDGNQWR